MERKLKDMTTITISERDYNQDSLLYVQNSIGELLSHADCSINNKTIDGRAILSVNCPEYYADIIKTELADKVAEIIAIKYKYEYFKKNILVSGLSKNEREILLASLIAADLEDDKKYAYEKIKKYTNIAIDGTFNFTLNALKNKWKDIVGCMPDCFLNSQLKDFVYYLLENKRKRVFVDDGRVYDCHYRRLKRSSLLDGDDIKIIREILLSNCGEVELSGRIPESDEFYLKEFYCDKIFFSNSLEY